MLLHGPAGHPGEWDTPAGRLSFRFRVVAVDQRGHGASERHPVDVSRAAAAYFGGGPVGAGWAAGLEEHEGGGGRASTETSWSAPWPRTRGIPPPWP
ncbi:alpha/beta fold hydrolase [Streptomyces sp. NPDC055058]